MMLPNPWIILGVVVSLLTAAFGGYAKGYRDADKTATIMAMAKDLAMAKATGDEWLRQATALAAEAAKAAERQAAAEAEAASTRTLIDDYAQKLAGMALGACGLSDDDARILRGIAGPSTDHPASPSEPAGRLRPPGAGPGD
jgi:hypothetical protein